MALKPGADTELDAQMLEDIAGDAPSMDLDREVALRSIPEVMVAVGLQPSKAAAKRYAALGHSSFISPAAILRCVVSGEFVADVFLSRSKHQY